MRFSAAALAVLLPATLPMTLPMTLPASALAQTGVPAGPGLVGPRTTGAITEIQPNTTGNDADLVAAPGATGAETITTNSAAGGNANLPERSVPNGSAGGGTSGQGGG